MSDLVSLLESAQRLGFIGARPIDDHLDQSASFVARLGPTFSGRIIDLGSGGGVPALPIALALPACEVVLVESMERRATFLEMAIDRLGLSSRLRLCHSPAELVALDASWRFTADVVCARGFGPPAMTAEIAAGLLKPGGRLVATTTAAPTSERWPLLELKKVGYLSVELLGGPWPLIECVAGDLSLRLKLPRKLGVPRKKPLF